MTSIPQPPSSPLLLATGPPQRRPPLAPLANALVVSSSGGGSSRTSPSRESSSSPVPPPTPPPLLAYLGDPSTLSLLDPGTGRELARLELDPSRDELCCAAWQCETAVVDVDEEGDRKERKRRIGRLFVATRTRLLLADAWADEGGGEGEDGERGRREGGERRASLSVSASRELLFWPRAVAVRSFCRSSPPSPCSFFSSFSVEVAVAGGPGVVVFSLVVGGDGGGSDEGGRKDPPSSFSFERVRSLCSPWPACAVAFSSSGDKMAAAGPAGQLWIWRRDEDGEVESGGGDKRTSSSCPPQLFPPPLTTPALHAQVPHERVTALEFSPRGDLLAVACWGGALLLYSEKKKKKGAEEEEEQNNGSSRSTVAPILPAGLTSGPAILALEATADDGGPPASEWELSGGVAPPAVATTETATAGGGGGPRATLLAWKKSVQKDQNPSPSLLALARAGRALSLVSVAERAKRGTAEAKVEWEVPAGAAAVSDPARSPRGEEGGEAASVSDRGGDGRGAVPEGLLDSLLPLPPRAATTAASTITPLPPAPPLPLPAGVRGLAVSEEGGEGGILWWCDAEGRVGRMRW